MRNNSRRKKSVCTWLSIGILCLFSATCAFALQHSGADPGTVLVSWKGGEITLLDFVKYLKVVKVSEFNSIKSEEVKQILSEMALDEYLFRRANKEKFAFDKVLLAIAMSKSKRSLLPPIYVEEEISRNVTVTDSEVGAAVGEFRPVYVVRVFSSRDKAKADLASTLLLKEGRKFEDVVREHSEGLSREAGGLYGEIAEGRTGPFDPDQFRKIAALGRGKFTDPIEMQTGWTIVYMERVISVEEQREAALSKVRDVVKLDKERRLYRDKVERLKKNAAIRWDGKARKELDEYAKKGEMDVARVPRSLVRRAVVTVNKSPIYAGEVVETLGASHGEKDTETFFEKRIEDELVMQEAVRRKLDRRIAPELDMVRRHWIARSFLEQKTKGAGRADDNALREYYDRNPDQFKEPEMRALQIIQVRDGKTAGKVQEEIRAGKAFDSLAQEYNDFEEARKAKGYAGFMSYEQLAPSARDRIFGMKEGEISETFEVKDAKGVGYFVVVRVMSIRPAGRTPFEKVNRGVIEDRVVSGRKSTALKAFLEGGPALQWREESIRKISTGG